MIGYKLMTQDMTTHGRCTWRISQTRTTSGEGDLCGPGWLHYYRSPELAVLHNPIHACITQPRLFRVRVEGKRKHDGWLKSGCTRMTVLEEIKLPCITMEQRIKYGIFCAKKVCNNPNWLDWANTWLSGKDRSYRAARAAVEAAWAAAEAWAAARAAAAAAAWAAEAAEAEAAAEAWAAAAEAAEWAAWAAARATRQNGHKTLNLNKLAKEALK